MNKKLDYMVYIGRFQPFHNAHLETIKTALQVAEEVIVLAGSANKAPDIKNPFTWHERETMIRLATPFASSRVHVRGISDQINDERWVQEVQRTVDDVIRSNSTNDKKSFTVGIIGYEKDDSSYYLKMFPQWEFVGMPDVGGIHATDIRTQMFEHGRFDHITIPTPVVYILEQFMATEKFARLREEYIFIQKYKQSWAKAPYPPTFMTADAIVIQSGHVLLVRRKAAPGSGLLAIPGGFVNQSERIEDAAIRELREETKLKVPVPVLKGSIRFNKVYDRPDRSLRGRTITQAFLFELAPGPLPKVKGSDDAEKAFWMPLSEVINNEDKFFEDHYMIIQDMVSKL